MSDLRLRRIKGQRMQSPLQLPLLFFQTMCLSRRFAHCAVMRRIIIHHACSPHSCVVSHLHLDIIIQFCPAPFERLADVEPRARIVAAQQKPPICSWCTSNVSPSCISSCNPCVSHYSSLRAFLRPLPAVYDSPRVECPVGSPSAHRTRTDSSGSICPGARRRHP